MMPAMVYPAVKMIRKSGGCGFNGRKPSAIRIPRRACTNDAGEAKNESGGRKTGLKRQASM
jgi:hypothetical protein